MRRLWPGRPARPDEFPPLLPPSGEDELGEQLAGDAQVRTAGRHAAGDAALPLPPLLLTAEERFVAAGYRDALADFPFQATIFGQELVDLLRDNCGVPDVMLARLLLYLCRWVSDVNRDAIARDTDGPLDTGRALVAAVVMLTDMLYPPAR